MELRAAVVSTTEELSKVFAVRAVVYMSEQSCPYDEEFDGNDFSGSHILGFVDNEPAATMRIRYFAGFAKIERIAVMPKFRKTSISRVVIRKGIDLCRRKGYCTLYGHAQKRLQRYWTHFGFKPMNKNAPLVYSDHEYIEMKADLEPLNEALTIMSDPYLLVRKEGSWDEEGALERSATRPPTNPH